MKKFVKVSLITAGVMLALGLVLCFVSGVAGGRRLMHIIREDNELDDKIETAVNRIGNALYEISDGDWGFVWNAENPQELVINGQRVEEGAENSSRTEDVFTEAADGSGRNKRAEFQIPTEGIREWEIVLGAGTFIIEEKEEADGLMEVMVEGVGSCDYRVEGNTLFMEGFKGIKTLGGNSIQNFITVRLPKDCSFTETDAQVGAGIMRIEALETISLEAEVGAGELFMNRVKADELSMEIGAGYMEASKVSVKDAELSVAVGECIFEGSITGNLDAECDMGNLELTLEGSEKEHNYEIECSAGNIELGNYHFTALAAEKSIQNGAAGNFEIQCNMGNIEIKFEEK